MRSYERQGLDIIPTVHMGAAVCALERKGIETNIGNTVACSMPRGKREMSGLICLCKRFAARASA